MTIAMSEEIKEIGQKLKEKEKKIAEEEDKNEKVWLFVELVVKNESDPMSMEKILRVVKFFTEWY